MFVVDLVCDRGHLFEGWYDSKDAFDEARSSSTLECAVCGDTHVDQRPSFRGIISRSSASKMAPTKKPESSSEEAPTSTPPPMPLEVQRALSQLVKFVKAHTEDAGDAFARRALAMHKGDEEPAAIHGTSTPDERQMLEDEGVSFVGIPIPEIDQN